MKSLAFAAAGMDGRAEPRASIARTVDDTVETNKM
jgi:hypothetical protein